MAPFFARFIGRGSTARDLGLGLLLAFTSQAQPIDEYTNEDGAKGEVGLEVGESEGEVGFDEEEFEGEVGFDEEKFEEELGLNRVLRIISIETRTSVVLFVIDLVCKIVLGAIEELVKQFWRERLASDYGFNLTAPRPPPGFRTNLVIDKEDEINLLGLLKVGVTLMYELCKEEWEEIFPADSDMDIDEGGRVGLYVATPTAPTADLGASHPQAQGQLKIGYVILGAYEAMTHLILNHELYDIKCELFLGQYEIGFVKVLSLRGNSLQAPNNSTNLATEKIGLATNLTSQSGSVKDAAHDFEITYTYDSTSRIDSADLFMGFLDGLATAAEFKEKSPCKLMYGVSPLSKTGQAVVSVFEESDGSLSYEMVKLALFPVWSYIVLAKRMFGMLTSTFFHAAVEVGTGRVEGLAPRGSTGGAATTA